MKNRFEHENACDRVAARFGIARIDVATLSRWREEETSRTLYVFDVRSLPNPHWEHRLRPLTGRDPAVIEYLERFDSVRGMVADLTAFLEKRIGEFSQANRSYLTIAIGCTGGQHRSVYIAEQLAEHFRHAHPQVLTRHDPLQKR